MQLSAEQEHDLDWSDRLQDWLDGDLDRSGRAAFEAHLAACTTCQTRAAEFKALDESLRTAAPRLAPGLTLDDSFDARIWDRIDSIDEAQRAAARRRLEQELQANLHALSRNWRRALAFMIPGVLAGIALAFALAGWLDDSGLTRTLIVESASEFGRDTSQIVRLTLTTLLGASLGAIVASWIASIAEH